MRYPQLFATKAIKNNLESGIKKGIIWHTQGSGKTALAFYNVEYLTNYFQRKKIISKFYFIVDRLDLLEQACGEFTKRGLEVNKINSKIALIQDFKSQQGVCNLFGKKEITVVNIQKFANDTEVLQSSDYNIDLQRIYFLDEAHRSYKPNGSFLASLMTSDTNAIMIALTGTPLLDNKSKKVFGDYIHKYYYDASIADGYTLRLIREGIETQYKIQLEDALKKIEVLKGSMNSSAIFSHPNFVKPIVKSPLLVPV
jgi:type I restriction enzyme R subunit